MKKIIKIIVFTAIIVIIMISCIKKSESAATATERQTDLLHATEQTDTVVPDSDNQTDTAIDIPFTRTIELKNPRMNGQDIIDLQKRLLSLGYTAIGEADGYYGPMTENVIKYIQIFGYHDPNGKVDKTLWDYIFDNWNSAYLKRDNFSANFTTDISTVLTAVQKFIEWKSNTNDEGFYNYDKLDIDHGMEKIINGLRKNRKYDYTFTYNYANEELETKTAFYFSSENNLVLRRNGMENASHHEYRLIEPGKFTVTIYSGINGLSTDKETYSYNSQTGVFTLTEIKDLRQ